MLNNAFVDPKAGLTRHDFVDAVAIKAKRYGRKVQLRPDWENVKFDVMKEIVMAKFANPYLQKKLLATGNVELIEGNYWHDTTWGICDGIGENHLGKILMKVRTYYSLVNRS